MRSERNKRGWTQEELSKKTGLSQKTIENFENNRPAISSTCRRIAEVLGIPVEALMNPQEQPDDSAVVACDPHMLSSGHRLSLDDLPSLLTAALGNVRDFLVVFASGRYPQSSGHIGLVSDCLYLPEVMCSILRIAQRAKLGSPGWCSVLDVDLMPDLNEVNGGRLGRAHLLLPGTGEVNGVVGHVLGALRAKVQPGAAGLRPAFTDNITGNRLEPYYHQRGMGFLTLCVNPWNPGAICILAGGVHSDGTTAALHLLNEYIKGDVNISLPEDAPRIGHGRVFMSRSVVYVGVKSVDLLTPQEDIHNVVCDLQRWKFYE